MASAPDGLACGRAVLGALPEKVIRYRVRMVSTTPSSGVSNTDKKLPPGGAAMLAIVIVAALSFAGVIGYIFYLTPGPNDHI